jgi:hypothetical protein
MRADEQTNDLMHRQAKLVAADEDSTAKQLRAGHYTGVSPGLVNTPKGELGFKQGFLVRDPAAMQITD